MTELVKWDICDTQQEIFMLAFDMGFDNEDFISKYMNSDFCKRHMDTSYSFYQTADPGYCMEYILDEIHPKKNDKHYAPSAIEWIGWTYRYLQIELNMTSKEIYTMLPLKTMLAYYPGMHTQDEDFFVDVIRDKLKNSK